MDKYGKHGPKMANTCLTKKGKYDQISIILPLSQWWFIISTWAGPYMYMYMIDL